MKILNKSKPLWMVEKGGKLVKIEKKLIPSLLPQRTVRTYISQSREFSSLSECLKNSDYGDDIFQKVLMSQSGEKIVKHIGVLDWEKASIVLNTGLQNLGVKKASDPLSDEFLIKVINSALSDWIGVSSSADENYLSEVSSVLSKIKSGGFSNERIYSLFTNAAETVYNDPFLVQELIPELRGIVDGHTVEFVNAIRGEYINQGFGILESLSIPDERAIKNLNDLGMRFMSESFKKNYTKLSDSLYKKLIRGLEDGLNYREVTEELAKKFPAQVSAYTKNFLDVTAHSVVSRSRSYGVMQSFSDAQIDEGVFTAVMDEVTTETCAFLDGQVVDIKKAKGYWDNQISKEEMLPQDAFPWINEKKSGGIIDLVLPSDGDNIILASGSPGNISWNEGIGINDYAGNMIPPLHGRCRSTIIYRPIS
jgi:hypothetical protein